MYHKRINDKYYYLIDEIKDIQYILEKFGKRSPKLYRPNVYQGDIFEKIKGINEKFSLIIIDPPYNVGKDFRYGVFDVELKKYVDWCERWLKECINRLRIDGSLYLFTGDKYLKEMLCLFDKYLIRKQIITWFKPNQMSMNRRGWKLKHEYIIFYVIDSSYKFNLLGDFNFEHTIWNIPLVGINTKEGVEHPTQKPLRVVNRIIQASSNKGDLVFSPFTGSGTDLISAMYYGRRSVGIELSHKYYRIIEDRIDSKALEIKKKIGVDMIVEKI